MLTLNTLFDVSSIFFDNKNTKLYLLKFNHQKNFSILLKVWIIINHFELIKTVFCYHLENIFLGILNNKNTPTKKRTGKKVIDVLMLPVVWSRNPNMVIPMMMASFSDTS